MMSVYVWQAISVRLKTAASASSILVITRVISGYNRVSHLEGQGTEITEGSRRYVRKSSDC